MSIKDPVITKAEIVDACRKGDYDKVAYFLSGKKLKKQRTPLKFFRAATDAHWLLQYRDEKSQYTLLHHSAVEGQNGVSKLLMDYEPLLVFCKSDKDILPIHLAAWNGHVEIVKEMILLPQEKPFDLVNALNIFNETPLHLAVQRDHIRVIMYLLKKNADPFIRNENRENVLDVAARLGKANAIQMLCQASPKFPVLSAYESLKVGVADIRRQFPTIYPLHLAAKNNHVECLKILQNHGFVIDYTTEDGTALHVAAACGQVDAVKYLLENGIDTEIKNQHGQTVLEMIIDLQENRRPEIAQFVKNPSGWRECRMILECRDQRALRRKTYETINNNEREAIWQRIPAQANVQIQSNNGRIDRQNIQCLPSFSRELVQQQDDRSPDAELSVRSDTGYSFNSHKARLWNSTMYDKKTGQPRFPITSPYNHGRHMSYNRNSDTLPVKFTGVRTKPSPQRASILPEGLSPFQSPQSVQNLQQVTENENMPYDNIPCDAQIASPISSKRDTNDDYPRLKKQTGYSTLPAAHFKYNNVQTVRPLLREDVFKFEKSPAHEQKLHNKAFTMSRTTCDREDSLGLTQSPRLDTRTCSVASSLSYACSTLGNKTPVMDSGFAPLAQPEEIVGSVTGSISGSAMFDDTYNGYSNVTSIFLGDKVKTPESPPSPNTSKATIFQALWKNNDPNYPISGSTPSTLSDIGTYSPVLTDASKPSSQTSPTNEYSIKSVVRDGQNLRNAPIPTEYVLDSRNDDSRQHHNDIRFRHNDHVEDYQDSALEEEITNSFDKAFVESVSLRRQTGKSNLQAASSMRSVSDSPKKLQRQRGYNNVINVFSNHELVHDKKNAANSDSTSGQSSSKASSSTATSFTEDGKPDSASDDAEWEQVSSVFESFGAAPCRESVFARDFAPRVAMYLQDRGSKALTLQMLDNALQTAENDRRSSRHSHKLLTISEWLEFDVGLSNRNSLHIGAVFEKYGFDKYTQLRGSLSVQILDTMGIEKSHQAIILNKIDQIEELRPSANAFLYVSDWLSSLELTDYLSNFFNAGYKNMVVVKTSGLDARKLMKIGVVSPGHTTRILYSLKRACDEINLRDTPNERLSQNSSLQKAESRNLVLCPECPTIDFVRVKTMLLTESIVYRAHQLGVNEITRADDSDEAHYMMESIKQNLKDLDKIPRVALVLTCNGIRVMDEQMQVLRSNHSVYTVRVVCQDKKDLNFFSYIARNEENRFFCYTFCVLTSAIATEIISSIGIIFEIRSRIDNNRSLDGPLYTCPHKQ